MNHEHLALIIYMERYFEYIERLLQQQGFYQNHLQAQNRLNISHCNFKSFTLNLNHDTIFHCCKNARHAVIRQLLLILVFFSLFLQIYLFESIFHGKLSISFTLIIDEISHESLKAAFGVIYRHHSHSQNLTFLTNLLEIPLVA